MSTPETPTLAEVILEAMENRVADIHTAFPGIIQSYDAINQVADVLPALKTVFEGTDGKEIVRDRPIITDVPVVFPRGGGTRLRFSIAQGDRVLVIMSERALEEWADQAAAQSVLPVRGRKHSQIDAVAIPGLDPSAAPMASIGTDKMRIGMEDGSAEVRFLSGGKVVIEGTTLELGTGATAAAARVGDTVVADATSDPTLFTWIGAVSTALGLTPPTSITSKVTTGSADVKVR